MWKVAVVTVVTVKSKNKAAVDHNAETVETSHYLTITPTEVLSLACTFEPATRERFKTNEQTSQPCRGCFFDQIIAQD
jgi:hypothetical protein